jgi:ribA/ribD-fused uncharacterized protein
MAGVPRNLRLRNPTYRVLDDGERIEGTWRPIFIHNGGTYFLTELKIYADGLIDCWELVDLDGFAAKVRSGWVATTIPDGGTASAHHLGSWRFADPKVIDAEMLITEVTDTLAQLQGRATTSDLCLEALENFRRDPSEQNRVALRSAYHAIPEHLRMYVLGDQDMADWPLRVLVGSIGDPVMPRSPPFEEQPITEEHRERAMQYFDARDERIAQRRQETNNEDPDGPLSNEIKPSVGFGGLRFVKGGGWADAEYGAGYLSNDLPTPIQVAGVEYPSVTHAYWALSTDDTDAREAIRTAEKATDARKVGVTARRRADWPDIRLAIMTDLVRHKFKQHPDLAEKLMATGDARIRSQELSGTYWSGGEAGRNWLGRILELVRSELLLARRQEHP